MELYRNKNIWKMSFGKDNASVTLNEKLWDILNLQLEKNAAAWTFPVFRFLPRITSVQVIWRRLLGKKNLTNEHFLQRCNSRYANILRIKISVPEYTGRIAQKGQGSRLHFLTYVSYVTCKGSVSISKRFRKQNCFY